MRREGVYTGAWAKCWKCGGRTPWWHWPGVPFCEAAPPDPKPRVLEFRHSSMFGGSYWMNTCIQCGASQGDNFVFLDPQSPLHALPQRPLPSNVDARSWVKAKVRHMVGL